MKKAFTLVELLIVVVVIAILASIAFRLAGIGAGSEARNKTIAIMQKLENAISGYYAAFGSYPPVPLQGRSRSIYYTVNFYGIQQVTDNPDTSKVDWKRVQAACKAQPVEARFPCAVDFQDYVEKVGQNAVKQGYDPFDGLRNPEQLSGKKGDPNWTDTQLFQFGLLSYLLPRYLLMMGYGSVDKGNSGQNKGEIYDEFRQWGDNNSMPCRFENGVQYESWSALNADLCNPSEKWKVAALPSQAVCARWLANLKGLLAVFNPDNKEFYGVNVFDGMSFLTLAPPPAQEEIYSSGDSQNGNGGGRTQAYLLDKVSCTDGWGNDLYYYSPPPYQGYRLWSAGPNGKTFPPWIPDEEIEKLREKNTIRDWLADDIMHLRD